MSLSKKMLRDIKFNKSQFIAIFLMAFLGIFAFCGICSEYYGLEQTSSDFYNETNLADGWIHKTGFNKSDFEKINDIAYQSERQAVVQSIGGFDNNPDITLHFLENNDISKFYVSQGKDIDIDDESGVWLDKRFADAKELKVGDNISFEFDGKTIEKEIKGIGYSPEYVYESSPTSITPNFGDLGFAYLSYKAYPSDIKYDTVLVKYNQSDAVFKEKLDDSVSYLSFTKQKDHVSVSQFGEEMAQHKMMGDIFPILFIIITFLTLLTTMTRIVSYQRTQIGILKAVGFKDSVIILHFISYGFFPVLTGSILGMIAGPIIIPQMFYPTMSSRYTLPEWNPGFDMSFIYVVVLLVLSSVLVTYLTCRSISKENPANTLRPKPPKLSSTNLIEKTKFWKHLSFNIR